MNWPGETLLIKLWETLTEKGIGGLLKPWQIEREALAHTKARRTELLVLADAEKEAEEIRSGRKKLTDSKYALALPSPEIDNSKPIKPVIERGSAIEVSTSAVIGDALRREKNIAKAIIYAESEIIKDPQKPVQRNIEDDWLYRWRDYAGSVSADELQSIWGRLLAGELKSPGTYSYRTLDFIKNLSIKEAKKIELMSRFAIADFISRGHMTFVEKEKIFFRDLLEFQNLGIISGVEAASLSLTLASFQQDCFHNVLCSNGIALIIKHDDPKKKLNLTVYPLTTLGKQVLRLGKFEPHEEYLHAVGNELKLQGATVTIANYLEISENNIKYFDEHPL